MNRVFIDMDGPLVAFDDYAAELNLPGSIVKTLPGAYYKMKPTPGGIEAVRALIAMGWEVWIATKPPTGVAHAYADKVSWLLFHLPELARNIIITHHKGLLGDEGDYLIDDRPWKASCEEFKGTLLVYGTTENTHIEDCRDWGWIIEYMREKRRKSTAGPSNLLILLKK